jgi:hypothetical protein
MAEHQPVDVVVYNKRYWRTCVSVFAIEAVLIAAAALTGGIHFGHIMISNAWWPFLFSLAYDLDAIKITKINQQTGVTLLEDAVLEKGGGLVPFVFRGLMELHNFPKETQTDVFPDVSERISRKSDEDETDMTLTRPVRITTAGPTPSADKTDLMGSRMTLEPTWVIQWQVEQTGFFEFFVRVNGRTWDEKYAFLFQQMRFHSQTQLMIEYTPSEIQKNLQDIIDRLLEEVTKKMSPWGIIIIDFSIQNLSPDHDTNIAFGEIPRARARAQARITEAEGNSTAKVIEAEADLKARLLGAEALVAETAAVGKGEKAAADAMGMSPERFRNGELVKATFNGTKLVITNSDGAGGALGPLARLIGFSEIVEEAEGGSDAR